MAFLIPLLNKKKTNFFFIIIFIITLVVGQRFHVKQKENDITRLIIEVKKSYSNHNYQQSLELLNQIDSSNSSSEIRYKLFLYRGLIYSKMNLLQRSLINFNLAGKIKDTTTLKLSEALVYEKLNDEENTLLSLNQAYALEPKNAFVLEKLGDYYFKKKNFYKASEYYEKSLKKEINEKKHRIVVKSLISFFLLNNQKKFNHYASRLSHIEKNAKYETFNLINVFNFFNEKQLTKSIKKLEKLMENSSTKEERLQNQYLLGLMQIINKEFANGSKNLSASEWPLDITFLSKVIFFNKEPLKAIKKLQKQEDYYFLVALYYFYFKDYYSSLEYLKKVKSEEAKENDIKLLMAKNYMKLNNFSAAETIWQDLPKEEILYQYEYLRYLLKDNRSNRAEIEGDFYDYYAESQDPLLFLIMTKHHISLKNYSLALNYLEKYLEGKQEEPPFYLLKLAGDLTLFAKESNDKTIFYYNQILQNSRDTFLKNKVINNLSYAYYTQNDYLTATKILHSQIGGKEFPATYYNSYILNNHLDDAFKKNNSWFLLEKGINSINQDTPHDLISKIYLEASLMFYQDGKFNKHQSYLKKAFKYDGDNSKLQLLIKKNKIKI